MAQSDHRLGRSLILLILASVLGCPSMAWSQETIILHGATQHDSDHIYSTTIRAFGAEVEKRFPGVSFIYHHGDHESLGTEKDFTVLLHRNRLDFAIVAPAHTSNVTPGSAFMDMPFLFHDADHWRRCLNADVFAPIEKAALSQHIRILGYAGGASRHLFAIPGTDLSTLEGLKNIPIRVMAGDIQSNSFKAIGMKPRPIPYSEIKAFMASGVIKAAENESHGLALHADMAPEVVLTGHAITVRPLCFNERRFQTLPLALQSVILEVANDILQDAREQEYVEDQKRLRHLMASGKIQAVEFSDREHLFTLMEPVKRGFAQKMNVVSVYDAIESLVDVDHLK